MKKIFCDRCGKEMRTLAQCLNEIALGLNASKDLSSTRYRLTSYVGGLDVRTYDLCDDCQHDLDNWLNNGREEEK
jgi:hypothetical protein